MFNKQVVQTILRYVISAIAAGCAAKFGVDQGALEGILLAILSAGMGIWGVIETMPARKIQTTANIPGVAGVKLKNGSTVLPK